MHATTYGYNLYNMHTLSKRIINLPLLKCWEIINVHLFIPPINAASLCMCVCVYVNVFMQDVASGLLGVVCWRFSCGARYGSGNTMRVIYVLCILKMS